MRELNAEHFRLSHIAATASQMGLGTLEEPANKALGLLAVLAKKFHNVNLPSLTVPADDVAKNSLAIIQELQKAPFMQSKQPANTPEEEPAQITVGAPEEELTVVPKPKPNDTADNMEVTAPPQSPVVGPSPENEPQTSSKVEKRNASNNNPKPNDTHGHHGSDCSTSKSSCGALAGK